MLLDFRPVFSELESETGGAVLQVDSSSVCPLSTLSVAQFRQREIVDG